MIKIVFVSILFDNSFVPVLSTHTGLQFALPLLLLSYCCTATASAQRIGAPLDAAVDKARASAVVLDWQTGAVLAATGPSRRGAPGSTIKPLLLEYALEREIVRPDTQVYCRRDLNIGARRLPCTHPSDNPVFTAETALAESCNTWFAELAKRYSGEQLEAAFNATRLPHASMLLANVEKRQLATLGLDGVTASPLELAQAYRDLLLHAAPNGAVMHGLAASVNYGMANQASVSGMAILGKTGTASDLGEAWTHGWFAGAIPGELVLVIYVPHGDGGTAALIARKFFQALPSAGHTQ